MAKYRQVYISFWIWVLKNYAGFIASLKYTKERSLKVDSILDKIDKLESRMKNG